MTSDTALESAATDEDNESGVDCQPAIQPVVRIREEHNISRRDIDPDALKVLYRLARNEYIAYLVGGGVRDLLLGRKPKDFDVSTNAKPEQIRTLFRNCILIGRRFRLAHVRYGDKIIETSTFRSTPKQCADPSDPEADLFQRDDNLFGSPQEDALRRDFTVNGLFYDIESFSIIDYVGGMEDLAARRIRSIGDPCIRFREDPVRMIRAVRFASRLNFTLEPETEDAIRKHGDELSKASPARLLEEITRLFAFSSGEKAVRLLQSTGLLRVILPEVADCLESDKVDRDQFWKRLQALDKGDTVLPDATPALIFSVLLQDALKVNLGRDWDFDASPRLRFDKVHAFLDPLALRLRFPRKLVDRIVHMYITQHRFANPGSRGKRGSIANFVTQDAFHEALALAEITLTAEGGQQTRLNHWRDMLAERIYGRDEQPHHHGGHGDRRHNGGNGNGNGHVNANGNSNGGTANGGSSRNGNAAATAQEQPSSEVEAVSVENGLPDDRKLSRSARRRRNKRMRRVQGGEGTAPASVASTASQEEEAVEATAPSTTTEAGGDELTSKRKSGRSRNNRRARGRKNESAAPVADDNAGESPEAGEPIRPLTAAAFWKAPEPEPVPEPEPETEKKGRGRKGKGDGKAKAKSKAAKDSAEEGKSAPAPEERKPLPLDRADEADIPMHWLDEI